jgi:hypothetical protein
VTFDRALALNVHALYVGDELGVYGHGRRAGRDRVSVGLVFMCVRARARVPSAPTAVQLYSLARLTRPAASSRDGRVRPCDLPLPHPPPLAARTQARPLPRAAPLRPLQPRLRPAVGRGG